MDKVELKKFDEQLTELTDAFWWVVICPYIFFFLFTAAALKVNHVWDENIIIAIRFVVISTFTVVIYSSRLFTLSALSRLLLRPFEMVLPFFLMLETAVTVFIHEYSIPYYYYYPIFMTVTVLFMLSIHPFAKKHSQKLTADKWSNNIIDLHLGNYSQLEVGLYLSVFFGVPILISWFFEIEYRLAFIFSSFSILYFLYVFVLQCMLIKYFAFRRMLMGKDQNANP